MLSPPRLVIPCYNPPHGWAALLVQRVEALQRNLDVESLPITIVNDGSTKEVADADRELIQRELGSVQWLVHGTNRGKGAALRTGVAAVMGPCVVTDVDLPYTVESTAAVCRALMAGADVVLGHRGEQYYNRVPPARRAISKTFRWVLRHVMRFPISDTQCGLKGFGERGRSLFLDTTIDRFLFDMEFVMLVSRHKELKVELVNARLNDGVRFSQMNYRILLRESANFLKVMLRGFLRR
ncbi:MAG: glycosyltransferase family 2 protein [Flavobacteriales bacterium]|nr:glycosyltransferase family 2 protein [Flavobacteriales bacterium]MBP9080812.1 glycosyltransferase family 2 protein [Flavobacteriales bacterium]